MSSLVLIGLNYRTASVGLRESLALADCGLRMALEDLHRYMPEETSLGLRELIILSTCNRLELYALSETPEQGWQTIERFLAQLQSLTLEQLQPHLYYKKNEGVVHHLMAVASGLDSMVLGEPQILGQVSRAYEAAHGVGTSGPILSELFTKAVHAGKLARHKTEISQHSVSISHAAIKLMQQELGSLAEQHLLVIGAGEMAEQAAQLLHKYGVQRVTFINRTYNRAQELAALFGGSAMSWQALSEALTTADIVLTATGAPHTVLYAKDVEAILPARNGRPLFLMDIAMPRDVEEAAGDLEGVYRYDIDHLQAAVDENLARRQAAIPQVELILQRETAAFLDWWGSRQVVPVLTALRQQGRDVADAEVSHALRKLDGLSPQEQKIIIKMAHRIVNKILHAPTMQLKEQAKQTESALYTEVVRTLFELPQVKEPEA